MHHHSVGPGYILIQAMTGVLCDQTMYTSGLWPCHTVCWSRIYTPPRCGRVIQLVQGYVYLWAVTVPDIWWRLYAPWARTWYTVGLDYVHMTDRVMLWTLVVSYWDTRLWLHTPRPWIGHTGVPGHETIRSDINPLSFFSNDTAWLCGTSCKCWPFTDSSISPLLQ